MLSAIREIETDLSSTRAYVEEARIVKLTVLHNPYAHHPIGFDVLGGPHDVQWGKSERDGVTGYGPVVQGTLVQREVV